MPLENGGSYCFPISDIRPEIDPSTMKTVKYLREKNKTNKHLSLMTREWKAKLKKTT